MMDAWFKKFAQEQFHDKCKSKSFVEIDNRECKIYSCVNLRVKLTSE